jgi:FkbM family methyltransferase
MRINGKIWLGTPGDIFWGRARILQKEVDISCELLGSTYGGHRVRLTDLNGDSIVYSAGVGEDVSFDTALIQKTGAVVHAFDPTPRAALFVERHVTDRRFVFHGYGLARRNGTMAFHAPHDPSHVSHSLLVERDAGQPPLHVPFRRLDTIMAQLGHDRIDVLKMDIEGAEYDVIDDLLSRQLQVRQILVEFHHQFAEVGFEPTRRALENLHRAGYRVFAFSESGREISLIRSARCNTVS